MLQKDPTDASEVRNRALALPHHRHGASRRVISIDRVARPDWETPPPLPVTAFLCRHPSAGPSVPRPSGRVGDQDHHRVAVAPWPFASAARPQRRSGMRTVSRVFSGAGDDEARVERGARFPDCRRSRPNCGPAPRREHSGRCGVYSFGISENQRVTVTKGDRPGGQNFPASSARI